jgi:ABC-type Na+ efflux pump permease subunit
MNESFKKGLKAFLLAFIIMFVIGLLAQAVKTAWGSSFNKDFFIANTLLSLTLGVIVIIIYAIDIIIRKKKNK